MAQRRTYQMTTSERQRRTFSESFKIKKVREIETGITKVSEICKTYEVTDSCVYKWINKYGIMKDKKERFVVESESDTQELLALKKKVAELERIVGQKQLLLDFKDKMIDIAEEMYGVDIKKKLSGQLSNTTGSKGKK
ncbi:MAG: transposase [Bacteroidales bacterium]|jgi:transposase-like protein|nr:transposase [Bacteroidales bacterium]